MKPKYQIRVYDWAPSGANDISIVGSHSDHDPRCEDGLEEALFGIDIARVGRWYDDTSVVIPLKTALRHIAISPVQDGSKAVALLAKYFRSVSRGRKGGAK